MPEHGGEKRTVGIKGACGRGGKDGAEGDVKALV